MANSTVVIIPTYNEAENLPLIVERTLEATDRVDILVVDDNSPDGTGTKADELAQENDRVFVVHRGGKEGLLAAYREGFDWALDHGYDVVCQMDADGSHAPEQLERLLGAIDDGADLVIGSRYIEGSEVNDWPRERYLLSKAGNKYISLALGVDVADMTAGFRAIRREVLEGIDVTDLSDKGYIFQVDLAHRALEAGFDVREVPVTFTDRTLGESKLDSSFVAQSLAEVTKWGAAEKWEFLSEGTRELVRFVRYELDRTGLGEAERRAEQAPEKVINLVSEVARITRHEIRSSGIGEVPAVAARGLDRAVEAVREGLKLGEYEVKRRS